MGQKTVLRVVEKTILSSELLEKLSKIFNYPLDLGQDVDFYEILPSLKPSYQQRMNSFCEAFQLIIDVIPSRFSKNKLEAYLTWCQATCSLSDNDTQENYQLILTRYTAFLVNAIFDCCQWSDNQKEDKKISASIELLNKAEQYVLMHKGRTNIATLCPIAFNEKDYYILQWERHLPPFCSETLEELKTIKANPLSTTPRWFRELPAYQQLFFHSSKSYQNIEYELKHDLNRLEKNWKCLTTRYDSITSDLITINDDNKQLPEWFTKELSISHQTIIKTLAVDMPDSNKIDEALRLLENKLLRLTCDDSHSLVNLRKLPYWFLRLSTHEQLLLRHTLNKNVTIDEKTFSFLSSRHTTLPGMRNFSEHCLFIIDLKGNVIKSFTRRLRSSHVASKEMSTSPSHVSEMYCMRNVTSIMNYANGQDIHYQTLISPVNIRIIEQPDILLDKQLQKSIHSLQKIHTKSIYRTNHPLNIAKSFYPTSAADPDCNKILNAAKDNLKLEKYIDKDINKLNLNNLFKFVCANNGKEFNKIRQLAHMKVLRDNAYANCLQRSELIKLVTLACTAIIYNQQSNSQIGLSLESNNEESELKQLMINLIETTHNQSLLECKDWPTIFADYWFLIHHPECDKLLTVINKINDLAQLTHEYDNTLNSGFLSGTLLDYYNRELWLSSLEGLLVMSIDSVSYGSCVSGKDRKAIELTHTDAMLLYREKYGVFPSLNDEASMRNNFIDLVVTLYTTRHAHENASQNAPGATGIKMPYRYSHYWPRDIADAIDSNVGESTTLTVDNILATNNEVKNISNVALKVKPNDANCLLAALKLKEASYEQLLDDLKTLVEEQAHWNHQKSYGFLDAILLASSPPQGITDIRNVLNDHSLSMIAKVAHLYRITVFDRPNISPNRKACTQRIYNIFINLYHSSNPEQAIHDAKEQIKAEIIENKPVVLNNVISTVNYTK